MSSTSVMAASGPGQAGERLLPASVPAWRGLAYAASMVFAVAWTLALGKDVHWDALNYHLYLGFSALNDRFALDFFGAGTPSYINPYAYVPLYLMTLAGWPALWIAVTLAAFHALVFWLTFEIALAAGVRDARFALPQFAMLAVLIAATNPVLLQGLGSTMVDIPTGVLVLGGWLGVVHTVRDGRVAWVVLAGALLGIAAALKLSNAVFAIAAVPALAFMPGGIADRARGILGFGVACALAFAALALPWSWQLWREFGNPFFPFLNQWFASPDFTSEPLRYERFMPSGWLSYFTRPFEMLSASTSVHTEPRAPDLRYVALIAALLVLVASPLLRRPQGASRSAEDPAAVDGASRRTLLALLTGFAVAWFLWLSISGNSRYFLPMAFVASVALALVLQRLHALWPSTTISAILLMFAVQAIQFALGTDWKRDGGAWEGPWLRVEIPERLRSEPFLYLSAGFMSGSAFVPYLHPQSGIINIGGFNVIGPGHPGGERAQALIDRNRDRLRILLPLPPGVVDRASLPSSPEVLKVYVRRFGLRVDASDCEFLRVEGNLRGERRPESRNGAWSSFIACRLVPAPEERAAYEREAAVVDPIFDRVEDTCPNLFHPRRPVTQEFLYWARTYHAGSEMQLYIDAGRVKYFFPLRGGDPIDIGSVADWQAGPQPFDCSRRTSPAFVNVSK